MRFLPALLITACFTCRAFAQKTYIYSDKNFNYVVKVDSALSDDGVNYQSSVKSISIYKKPPNRVVTTSKEDENTFVIKKPIGTLFQTIVPEENSFSPNTLSDGIFTLQDMNFDGINDFRIVQFIPANPNVPYYIWVYDKSSQQFKGDTVLEVITSPEFDTATKKITSEWTAGCCDNGTNIYQYINGKLTLIEANEHVMDEKDQTLYINTTKKLINGEMKLVETKTEKRLRR